MAFDQLILRGFMLAVLLGAMAAGSVNAGTPVVFMHIHGLGFSADGARLMIGCHQGMVAYADGRWAHMGGPGHDHAGFSVTRNALYSSGHPAPGSGLPDPVGLDGEPCLAPDGSVKWQAPAPCGIRSRVRMRR